MKLEKQIESEELLQAARGVFDLECEALNLVKNRLNSSFLNALAIIDGCKSKVVITGIGKSGIAGRKIAATFSSVGVSSVFLHAGEAGHGDLGMVSSGDVALALSYSGETHELVELIPRIKLLGAPIIAITGNPNSALANSSEVVLNIGIPNYPWPFGLLPTASNAVTVAIGDALAVSLLMKRGFKEEHFAALHPGGLLGRKLLVKVGDLMHIGEELPVATPEASMREAVMIMTAKRLGVVCVIEKDGKLSGIITDGDLRRLLERDSDPLNKTAGEAMTRSPKSTTPGVLAAKALHTMESHAITSLPVIDENDRLAGLIHLHDILKLETQT